MLIAPWLHVYAGGTVGSVVYSSGTTYEVVIVPANNDTDVSVVVKDSGAGVCTIQHFQVDTWPLFVHPALTGTLCSGEIACSPQPSGSDPRLRTIMLAVRCKVSLLFWQVSIMADCIHMLYVQPAIPYRRGWCSTASTGLYKERISPSLSICTK
jgi:hypothetical protein